MNLTLQALTFVTMIILASYATEVKKCEGVDLPFMDDLEVELADCTTGRCKLPRGEEYDFKQTFTAIADADKVSSIAITEFRGVALRVYGFDDPNVCQGISEANCNKQGCPLVKGTKYVHKRMLEIGKDTPQMEFDVQWYYEADGQNVTCFEIPIEIV